MEMKFFADGKQKFFRVCRKGVFGQDDMFLGFSAVYPNLSNGQYLEECTSEDIANYERFNGQFWFKLS